MVKSEKEGYASKCLMVLSGNSEPRGYMTNSGKASESCFAAKTIPEQVKECKKVVDNVHSIIKSLNIPSLRYDSELDDLSYTISNFSHSLKGSRISNSNLKREE